MSTVKGTTLVNVSELKGVALDYAVALCEGYTLEIAPSKRQFWLSRCLNEPDVNLKSFQPSSNWSQGGPIIERENMSLAFDNCGYVFATHYNKEGKATIEHGNTYLIAAMRCYVASVYGQAVEIPDELLNS